ncbi:type I polyketide synthase [Geminicoccus roseus]|uniref:type I polyketide synthase n=1 Tax=Geminicoccus roseus TaxID=404900 RepID=UPI00040BD423|nr:type I polyketide synthase [Geminicoccus roseus]
MTGTPPARDLRAILREVLARQLGIEPGAIDERERFHRYGLDSAGARSLIRKLGQELGRPLAATVVWDHPTLERLARHLEGATVQGGRPPVTPLAPDAPIAIVGLSCRLPGAADPAAFWQLLLEGTDAIREVPPDRWPIDRLYDPDPQLPGRMSTRFGGFLDQVDRFDAEFFQISPREAAQIDPQQRLALELAWEACEDAAWRTSRLAGKRAGVFLGAMWSDYARLLADAEGIAQHTATGQDTSIVSARISYVLGLDGPSLTVNTACSSALVAVHLACQSLRSGESELALAGGVHLVLSPDSTIAMTKFGAMAPDGRCKAFDASANGYVRGEGGGLVALKPLARAQADGDRIYAVILGSAVNNDGPSNGLTAPNPDAQRAMLDDALAAARLAPAEIDYVEAHGTGTALGDPIEAGALGAVLGRGRAPSERLRIGSVKTNIGHLEAAAGAAGLIKTVLALQARHLPASLHFHAPSPHIDFEKLNLQVQARGEPWPERGHPPTAGVSSFGFGGTNAHVVLRAGPEPVRAAADPVWVFAGNGGVWPGMGRDLLAHAPEFAELVDRLDRHLAGLGCEWRLRDLLSDGRLAPRIEEPAFAQPALYAWQLGVAVLLRVHGIVPAAVVGHSVGEIAASVVAGILDEADGLRIVVERSRLQAETAGRGTMALAMAESQAVLPLLGPDIAVAGRNAPRATLLSGAPEALDACLARLEAAGMTALPVRVPVAYHGPQMEPLRPRLEAALQDLRPRDAAIPFFSTVTGDLLPGAALDAAYWGRNLRQPVAFHEAITTLGEAGHRRFVEIGPHSLLAAAIRQTLPQADSLPLTRRGEDEIAAIDALAGRLGSRRAGGRSRHLLVLSARSEAALWQLADRWAGRLPQDFADLCHTALVGRERFPWRLTLHAADGQEARARLLAREVRTGHVPPDRAPATFDPAPRPGEDLAGFLDRAAQAFVAGDEIDGDAFDQGEPWRVCAAPTYPFQRRRHWLPARARHLVDPAWLLDLAFEPQPPPGWPDLPLAAEDPERTRALDALATRAARDALAAVPPAGRSPRHARLTALLAGWPEPEPPPAELGDGPDLRLLQRLAARLPEILRGEVEPLDVLFPGGDFAEAQRLYAEAPLFAGPARALGKAARRFAKARGGSCRILEIGAGTGGLTRHLLDALDSVDLDYLYTDLSPAFLSWGRQQFGDWPGFRTGLFDLEAAAPAGGFDLVVAANAVHATADIRASLRAALAQLAPGGHLALVELVQAPRWIDLVFGTTEGWWRFSGDPRRPDHALLDAAAWRSVLEEVGLEPVSIREDGDAHGLIVARRPSGRSFGILGQGPLAERLARDLPASGSPTDLVLVADDQDIAGQLALLAPADPARRRWLVHQAGETQAALRGAFAALALDQPETAASAIEMADAEPSSIALLLAELDAGGGEDRLRIDQGRRLVARLQPRAEPFVETMPVRPDGLYVVAGGLGMLGRAFAGWLVEQGARHLLLVGRSQRADDAVEPWRLAGAKIRVVQLDLATNDAVPALARLIDRPLAGLVHAAGSASGDPARLVADKLAIARTLAAVASDHRPDFLVLASSAAGVWGVRDNPGYAAASAGLDAWAADARRRGIPATSLALGRLAERGLLSPKDEAALDAAGLAPLPLAAVCRAALDAAAAGLPSVVMARADWPRFLDTIESRRRHPLFDRLRPKAPAAAAAAERLPSAPARPQARVPELRRLVADILGHADPALLDPQRGLFEQGLDSLMALSLRRRLEDATGSPVPASVLFSHPSIAALEQWLAGRTGARAVQPGPVAADTIAIVGIGCRFPGIHGPDAFAEALWHGTDLIRLVPPERWPNDRWYDPDPTRPGRIASRFGGFLDGVDLFDPGFFGISPREAIQMDPQQRLLLETSWEALEHAAIAPDRLAGTATAIFVGATGSDYATLARQAGVETLDGHSLTGQPSNTLAGRVAHLLGTEGPAMVLDTACSSSLVAFHLAIRALRSGEATLALAAGVNLVLAPENSVILSQAGLLAPDGRCKTFDAKADGYVRAEGCGVVVLKPLARAQADGDPILAVVRGSAVNHDGRSSGFTAPNGLAQEAVIRAALAEAGLEPAAIGMIEAHGTGTRLGDPIELDALGQVFAGRASPLLVGSVKTNFGHTEAAAGIAGVIKATLALKSGTVPPHLHFDRLNPHVAATATPIRVPVAAEPWPVDPPRAGVSAFGASGTNAHVVLEAPPPTDRPAPAGADAPILVTGATPEAVRTLGRRLHAVLAAGTVSLADVAYSMAQGRARLPWWAIAHDAAELDRLEPRQGPIPELPATAGRRIALPTYPFARERYWIAPPAPARDKAWLQPPQRIAGTGLVILNGRLGQDSAWIRDHRVEGTTILPATGFLALCVAAGAAALTQVELLERLDVPEQGRPIQLVRHPDGKVELFAEDGEDWRRTGTALAASAADVVPLPAAPSSAVTIDAVQHQAELAARGFGFGQAFHRIRTLHRTTTLAEAELALPTLPTDLEPDPASLDHALQTLTSLLPPGETWLPARIGQFAWIGGQATRCRARLHRVEGDEAVGDACLLGPDGGTVAHFSGIRFRRVGGGFDRWIHEIRWRPVQAERTAPGPGWHVLRGAATDVPADAQGVVDLRPLDAPDPASCLSQTAGLVRLLASRPRPPRLLLVSRGAASAPPGLATEPPAAAILAGLVPSIDAEHPELRCAWIDLDPADGTLPEGLLSGHQRLALRGGTALVPELARVLPLPAGTVCLTGGTSLDDLKLAPMAARPPGSGEVQVRIQASGLNFKDTLAALGRVPGGELGLEAAGRVTAVGPGVADLAEGDAVVLFAPGAHRTHLTLPAHRCARYPAPLSPACAASLPIAFLTAWHGLVELAAVQPGQRVLVHAGAGGVGMAAIQLAVWRGAHVFATASPGKQDWARRSGAEATASSRDTGFASAVRAWSGGQGVDLVVHALGQEIAEASASLLAPNGCFIELGNAAMPPLPPQARHLRYDLEQPLAADPGWFRAGMASILELVVAGTLRPLPRTDHGAEAAGEAFAALAQGRTVGKTVLLWPEDRLASGTWLVTGGSGAVGGAIARWLAEQGGGRIVLAGRRAPADASFETVALDIGDRDAVARLLERLPDLVGIVHAAGIVQDTTLARLGDDAIAASFHAKLEGARHLDELTRERKLAAFVLVSSTVAHTGAAGQAAYASANAWLEGLAAARRRAGLPATVVAFGPWQAGMFQALAPVHRDRLLQQGYRAMAPAAAAAAAGAVIRSGLATRFVMDRVAAAATAAPPATASLRDRLEKAPSDVRQDLLGGEIAAAARRLLGFPEDTRLDRTRVLRDLGLDSLLAVSFRNELARGLALDLPASLAFDHPTLDALTVHLDGLLFPKSDGFDELEEDDLARLLASELEDSA